MYSVFDPRRYEIRKNHALVDLNTYIQSVINNDHPHGSYMEMMSNPHPLVHDEITGVEADAAKYAYDNNLVPQLNSIYHEGPSNPSYMQAFRGLVNAGAPFINEAIKRSNNMGVHEQIPMAFDAEGRLTSQWRGGSLFTGRRIRNTQFMKTVASSLHCVHISTAWKRNTPDRIIVA